MAPKKAKIDPQDGDSVSLRTRTGQFYYTRLFLSKCSLNETQRIAFDAKFVSKNLGDVFLPTWNMSSLQSRIRFSKEQASLFLTAVADAQRQGAVPKAKVPSPADYDAVVTSITMGVYGEQQHYIDEHVRSTGVLCVKSTVNRRLHSVGSSARRRNLSQGSINIISDMLYCSTAATDCKPANSARRFVRAFAILERCYCITNRGLLVKAFKGFLGRNE